MKIKKQKNQTNKVVQNQIGIVLFSQEFTDIIFGKTNKIKRTIKWGLHHEYIKENGKLPPHIIEKYKPGTVMFVQESYRPELKANGDIYRHSDDKETFVPQTNKTEKWRKVRWHSAFRMRKANARLYLKIIKITFSPKTMNITYTIEIDMEKSIPAYWPIENKIENAPENSNQKVLVNN